MTENNKEVLSTNREFKVLDDRTHVLERPGMYIGGVRAVVQEQWIADPDAKRFSYKQLNIVPGLMKIVSEIIDNSVDVAIDTNFKAANKIQVKVDDKSITVSDNGIGIPVKSLNAEDKRTLPEIAWTTLRAGTSFGADREKIGANGLGGTATNIFSKKFIGVSDDGKKRQTIECLDNMSVIKPGKIKASSGKSGVEVYFEPDLARFGINKINQEHQELIYQRLFNLAISFPKIKFSFNGKQVNVTEKKFAEMFSPDALVESSNNTTICVFPNSDDEFRFFAQLNGINTFLGGSHVDYVANEITTRIRDKLVKKYKTLRPGDVKNKMGLAVIMTSFKNPEFNSQSKEELKNAWSDIGKHIAGEIDFDLFAKKLLKNEAFIGPIVETFKIKEELKARQELKKAKKAKVKSDKYMSPIGEHKYLFLCEGQSAYSSLCSCLGRDGYGYYSLRGLPINCLENSIQKIAANQEFKDVMNILGLDMSNENGQKTIDFEKVVIATDQDFDGIHLSSMLIGWFRKFAPGLFNEGRVCKLQTPLVIVKDKKDAIREYFFDLDTFKKWEASNRNQQLKIIYQKGLGSIEREDISWLMSKNGGIEQFLYELSEDETSFSNVDLWLTGESEQRKDKLRKYTLNIDLA